MNAPLSNKYELLDRLAEEFAERFRRGERPSLTEYIDRYPNLAEEIRDLFPAMVEMERAETAVEATATPLLQVGDYQILRELGRGGMGVVYEAEQLSLGRRVAVKVLRHVAADTTVRQRFHREARAAAQLHHTNIVPVFEVGEDRHEGWYAMQLIHGQGLDQIIDELRQQRQPPSGGQQASEKRKTQMTDAPRAKLRVRVGQVTQALASGQFACLSLDPSTPSPAPPEASSQQSVLDSADSTRPATRSELSVVDSAGGQYYRSVARIGRQAAEALAYAHARGIIHRDIKPSNLLLDTAGVVWITDFGLAKTQDSALTAAGDIVGTLRYMAPERFKGEGDARSDVYALGLTLYELLVLRPAIDGRDRLELIDRVKNQEPVRPRALDRRIPRDLETIVLEATHKEANRRYQTAEAMAEDLRRFLANEPIKARRTSHLTRLRLWCRRHPALAVLLLVLMFVAAGSTVTAFYLQATLVRAEKAELEGKHKLWESYLSQAQARRMSRQSGQRFASLRAIKEALSLPVPPGHSRDELRTETIAALCLPDLELAREGGSETVGASGFAIDCDFQRYAWGDREGVVHICRLSDDAELLQLPGGSFVENYGGLQFSPDGRFLHQVCGSQNYKIRSRLWDLDAPEPRVVLDDDHNGLAFRPDGREVAVSYRNRTVRFLETISGRELRRFTLDQTPNDRELFWNPKLPQLLIGTPSMCVLDVDTGAVVEVGPKIQGGRFRMAWHPEGRLLAVSGHPDCKIYLWDVPAGRLAMPPLADHKSGGVVMCFNDSGDRLLSADWSNSWRLWDTRSGRLLLSLPGIGPYPFISRDNLFVGAGNVGSIGLYRFRRGEELRTLIHHSSRRGFQGSRGSASAGRLFASHTDDGIALVDVARGEEAALLPLTGTAVLCFDSEGALWTHGPQGLLRWPLTLDPITGQRRYGPPKWVFATTKPEAHGCSTDARIVGVPLFSQGAAVFHRDSQRVLPLGPQDDVRSCAVSPDGRWVATGSHGLREGAGDKLWDSQEGRHVKDLPVGGTCRVRFSPGGKWLLTTGGDPRLWAVGTWEEGPSLGGTSSNPLGAFSRDDKLLALGGEPSVVRLIVTDTGVEIARMTTPEQTRLFPCDFTPDGTKLIASGAETTALYLFDLRAIRAGLAEMDLDWDAPPLPVPTPDENASSCVAAPMSIQFEMGDVLQWLTARALVDQAQQLSSRKEHAKALALLRQAVKIAPSLARHHNNLAWHLLLTGPKELRDPAEALNEAKKAVELEPKEPLYVNTLGVALYYTGQFAEAVPVLERSMREQGGQADAFDLFFLAMCHHRLGDAAKAKDCHERGKNWFQDHKEKLNDKWVTELTAIQAESESVLAGPPGQAKKQ
jgi:serine/threonine protein kinase/WD40 repeat protein/Tfp pilus assembly protein PilF